LRGGITGRAACVPCAAAWQPAISGQSRQRGLCGVQIVAPSSINASLQSPAAPAGAASTISRAISHNWRSTAGALIGWSMS